MSNSPLINGTLLTNNCSKPRNNTIQAIVIHYMAWYTTAKTCCESFIPSSRRASANYCIGKDGEIWLNVEEKNRAWTTGNASIDNRAITIECANYVETSGTHVNGQLPNATYTSLIKLCADIFKRNGIKQAIYDGTKTGSNLHKHKWYQDTDCPGPWLDNKFEQIAKDINKLLNGGDIEPQPTPYYNFGGTYKCMVDTLNVRTAPSITVGKIVAQYHKGQTVILDDWYENIDGLCWGRYTGSSSGLQRYICVGRATGKIENDDYLIKIS